jgi:hypothetical protein
MVFFSSLLVLLWESVRTGARHNGTNHIDVRRNGLPAPVKMGGPARSYLHLLHTRMCRGYSTHHVLERK